ncbi:hypothetical protein [Lentzea sp. NPDC051838]|uniref:hypothetical protein n=1 Tax=Lentzea sp. NPDC051838 TaxID=3154849 RepID=UPI003442AFE5
MKQHDLVAPAVVAIALFLAFGLLAVLFVFAGPFILMRMNDDLPLDVKGDPSTPVMFQMPGTGPALQYGGVPVHDACSLVTSSGLSSFGARLSRDHAVRHSHLAGDVPAGPAVSGPVSTCSYTLWGREVVDVSVHQTPFNSASALGRLVDEARVLGSPARSASSMSVASWHESDSEHLVIWNASLVVSISLQTADSTGAFEIDTLMANLEPFVLSQISSGPTAPTRHAYDAPARHVKDPCSVASAEAYALAFPALSTSPSIVDGSYPLHALVPESEAGRGNSRRVQLSCARSNIVDSPGERRTLQVDLVVWDRAEAAAANHRPGSETFLADTVSVTASDARAAEVIRTTGVFR